MLTTLGAGVAVSRRWNYASLRKTPRLDAHRDLTRAARSASDGRVMDRARAGLVSFLVSFTSVHSAGARRTYDRIMHSNP